MPGGKRRKAWIPRSWQAQFRDFQVLFLESRQSLFLFFILILGGTLVFHIFYRIPGTSTYPGIIQSIYAVFSLIFFQPELPFPDYWALQILYFLIPILGLAVVADGVIRFWGALTNKKERRQEWQVAMASTYKNHIIVCGFGKIGYRVSAELVKFRRDVIAIESNPNGRFIDKAKDLGITLLIADARRTKTLLDANIKKADAIVPCTDDELTNLDIALNARELNSGIKVVMRMFDPDLAKRVENGFGIHTAFSASALTAPVFAAAAMRLPVKYSFYLDENLLNISEICISPESSLLGWTVAKLAGELDLSVIYYQDKEITDLHPDPSRILNSGTKILVLASLEKLQHVIELNSSGIS
jgi:voltage-gated potassium channel